MNKELCKAIMDLVDAKIALAREEDRGRETSHEWVCAYECDKVLDAFFDKDTHELAVTSLHESLNTIPKDWWLEHLGENRLPIRYRGDRHTVVNSRTRWEARLQHVNGGLLTSAEGETAADALSRAVRAIKEHHGA